MDDDASTGAGSTNIRTAAKERSRVCAGRTKIPTPPPDSAANCIRREPATSTSSTDATTAPTPRQRNP